MLKSETESEMIRREIEEDLFKHTGEFLEELDVSMIVDVLTTETVRHIRIVRDD